MRVVVTGGAGFIGANLCRQLLGRPEVDSVVVIDDLSTGDLANLDGVGGRPGTDQLSAVGPSDPQDRAVAADASGVTDPSAGTSTGTLDVVEGTICDDADLDRAVAGADAVVHLAALGSVPRSVANPMATHHANATGTVMVLEAARRHGGLHTVVASSSSVYGSNPVLPKHEDLATRPMSPYAASKLLTEGATLAWGNAYEMPVLPFRFFNVFGPLQPAGHVYAAVIPAFVDAALRGMPVTIHGDGTQSRDFTYVGTVTSVITDAIVRRVTSAEPVNLAFGTRVTLLDVLDQLEGMLGHPIEREHVETRKGDVPHSQAANDRLRALFPDVAPVALPDGLRATVDWMGAVVARSPG